MAMRFLYKPRSNCCTMRCGESAPLSGRLQTPRQPTRQLRRSLSLRSLALHAIHPTTATNNPSMHYVRIGKNFVNLDQVAWVHFDTEDAQPKKATLFFTNGETKAPSHFDICGDPARMLFEHLNNNSEMVSTNTGEPPRQSPGGVTSG